jgi:hypothetical protein
MENSKEVKLAVEIAQILNDMDAIDLHIKYAERYSEKLLRDKLRKVMETPAEKVRTTRARFYNYLIQQHEKKQKYLSGN